VPRKSPHNSFTCTPKVFAHKLNDDGVFPNSKLPLLLYRKGVAITEDKTLRGYRDANGVIHTSPG